MRFSMRSMLVGFVFVAILCTQAPFVHKVPDVQTYVVEAVNGSPTPITYIQCSKEEHYELNSSILGLLSLEAIVLAVWFGSRWATRSGGKETVRN